MDKEDTAIIMDAFTRDRFKQTKLMDREFTMILFRDTSLTDSGKMMCLMGKERKSLKTVPTTKVTSHMESNPGLVITSVTRAFMKANSPVETFRETEYSPMLITGNTMVNGKMA